MEVTLCFFGAFAIVLNFLDRVPSILVWIYEWGETVAWAIKIGLVVVGAILYFMGGSAAPKEAEEDTEEE